MFDFISGTSWYASIFLVVNAALGAGLLNFPAAYDQSGGLSVAIGIQMVGFLSMAWKISNVASNIWIYKNCKVYNALSFFNISSAKVFTVTAT